MSALARDLAAAYFTGFILFGLNSCFQQEFSGGAEKEGHLALFNLAVAVNYSGFQAFVVFVFFSLSLSDKDLVPCYFLVKVAVVTDHM